MNQVETQRGIQGIIVTGPVGAGKTTVSLALSELLEAQGISHALIDMDWLRWLYPSKSHDPFRSELGYKNLAALAKNYLAEGAKVLILADVVETLEQKEIYQEVIPEAKMTIVRLSAQESTLHDRLKKRESEATLPWYKNRATELKEIMESRLIGDWVVETEGKSAKQLAVSIVENVLGLMDLGAS